MRKLSSRVCFLISLMAITIFGIPGWCQAPEKLLSTSEMEQIIQPYVAKKQFMGAILVARGDQVLLNKGYGFANLEWHIPDSPSVKFRLGSLTKQFTAASILLLEDRGKLHVEDPVNKYIPDVPAAWNKITIFNLLTHTSGIPNFTAFPEFETFKCIRTSPEHLIARFRDKPLNFEPGEKYEYSNSGYAVLGYLIEKISGESYQRFLQENIFIPLGMKDSGYDSNSAIISRRASGYSPGPREFLNASFIDMTVPFSAGGLYSTTIDLLRWESGLFGNKLLPASAMREMTTPYKNGYAFGLEVHIVNGRKVIYHDGSIAGFNSILAYYPEDKLTVIVLANMNGRAQHEIAQKLALLMGETLASP